MKGGVGWGIVQPLKWNQGKQPAPPGGNYGNFRQEPASLAALTCAPWTGFLDCSQGEKAETSVMLGTWFCRKNLEEGMICSQVLCLRDLPRPFGLRIQGRHPLGKLRLCHFPRRILVL